MTHSAVLLGFVLGLFMGLPAWRSLYGRSISSSPGLIHLPSQRRVNHIASSFYHGHLLEDDDDTKRVDPNRSCPPDKAITSRQPVPPAKEKLLITYMAQKNHSSYGGDNTPKLRQILNLLERHVLPWTPADVVVFHEGDFTDDEIADLTAGRPQIRFEVLQHRFWCLPYFLDAKDQPTWFNPRFSVGYRHMIRWYSMNVFLYAHEAGYEWVMRLDDESFVWTPIKVGQSNKVQSPLHPIPTA